MATLKDDRLKTRKKVRSARTGCENPIPGPWRVAAVLAALTQTTGVWRPDRLRMSTSRSEFVCTAAPSCRSPRLYKCQHHTCPQEISHCHLNRIDAARRWRSHCTTDALPPSPASPHRLPRAPPPIVIAAMTRVCRAALAQPRHVARARRRGGRTGGAPSTRLALA